jgi:hypothetical protein
MKRFWTATSDEGKMKNCIIINAKSQSLVTDNLIHSNSVHWKTNQQGKQPDCGNLGAMMPEKGL